jgi:hypothetical protein
MEKENIDGRGNSPDIEDGKHQPRFNLSNIGNAIRIGAVFALSTIQAANENTAQAEERVTSTKGVAKPAAKVLTKEERQAKLDEYALKRNQSKLDKFQNTFEGGSRPGRQPKANSLEPTGAVQKTAPEVAQDKSVEKISENKWKIVPPSPEKNGEGMRGPSAVTPLKYEYYPITLGKKGEVKPDGPSTFVNELFPLPRDIGETELHDCVLQILTENGSVTSVKVVTSQPNNNQFLHIEMRGGGRKNLKYDIGLFARTSTAVTPEIKDEKLIANLSLNQKLNPTIVALKEVTKTVFENTTYDMSANLNGQSGIKAGRGDCGTQSRIVQTIMRNPNVKLVSGYNAESLGQFPGQHAWLQLNNGIKGDPAMGGHVAPINKGDVIAIIEEEFNFEGENEKQFNGKINTAPNGGYTLIYGGELLTKSEFIYLSVPGKGPKGAWLAANSTLPPDLIEKHKNFVKERERINKPDFRVAAAGGEEGSDE